MALKSTIYKINLQISNIDRGYYAQHQLTLAQHPSETEQRMMVRLLAFIYNASEKLIFCKGLSNQDEADLWQKNLNNEITLWIEAGQPDEKRLRQACRQAQQVIIYTYSGHSAELWWDKIQHKVNEINHLNIYNLDQKETQQLINIADRTMSLNAIIEDNSLYLSSPDNTLHITPIIWK